MIFMGKSIVSCRFSLQSIHWTKVTGYFPIYLEWLSQLDVHIFQRGGSTTNQVIAQLPRRNWMQPRFRRRWGLLKPQAMCPIGCRTSSPGGPGGPRCNQLRLLELQLPSGNDSHNYGKSPSLMGKSMKIQYKWLFWNILDSYVKLAEGTLHSTPLHSRHSTSFRSIPLHLTTLSLPLP